MNSLKRNQLKQTPLNKKKPPKTIWKCLKCDSRFGKELLTCPVCGAIESVKSVILRRDKHNKEKKHDVAISGFTNQVDLFNHIWKSRFHASYISTEPLDRYYNTPFFYNLFSHVLPKGRFPKYKLYIENIVLLTPEEHTLIDAGTEQQRNEYAEQMKLKGKEVNFKKYYDLKERLKRSYNEYTNS